MTEKPIYLDYNATTPIDPGVRDAILPYLDEHFGNPFISWPDGLRVAIRCLINCVVVIPSGLSLKYFSAGITSSGSEYSVISASLHW